MHLHPHEAPPSKDLQILPRDLAGEEDRGHSLQALSPSPLIVLSSSRQLVVGGGYKQEYLLGLLITKYRKLGGFHRNGFLHSSGGQKSEIEVSAGWVLSVGSEGEPFVPLSPRFW